MNRRIQAVTRTSSMYELYKFSIHSVGAGIAGLQTANLASWLLSEDKVESEG